MDLRFSHPLLVLLLCTGMQFSEAANSSLADEYQYSSMLSDSYTLHWDFDLDDETIMFAVNVSTTGWVGFGLSPDGQMPGSDVVIGWVDDDGSEIFAVSMHAELIEV